MMLNNPEEKRRTEEAQKPHFLSQRDAFWIPNCDF